jgi:hypothetical protein
MRFLKSKSTNYPDHGHHGDRPPTRKIPMVEPRIEPGTSWLVVRSSDHQTTRLVLFIIWNRFTSTKYPYNPEIKSTTYHKVTGHDFLVDNGKKGKTLTNYFICCQCVMLLLRKSLRLCCYRPAQIKLLWLFPFQRNDSDRNYPMIGIVTLCLELLCWHLVKSSTHMLTSNTLNMT